MGFLGRAPRLPVEYFILSGLHGEGPAIGYLGGRPICGTMVDGGGKRYRYAGMAPRRRDGAFDVAGLRPGEWLVEPGLIYVADDGSEPSAVTSAVSRGNR
jgi:hypothetical protein